MRVVLWRIYEKHKQDGTQKLKRTKAHILIDVFKKFENE